MAFIPGFGSPLNLCLLLDWHLPFPRTSSASALDRYKELAPAEPRAGFWDIAVEIIDRVDEAFDDTRRRREIPLPRHMQRIYPLGGNHVTWSAKGPSRLKTPDILSLQGQLTTRESTPVANAASPSTRSPDGFVDRAVSPPIYVEPRFHTPWVLNRHQPAVGYRCDPQSAKN